MDENRTGSLARPQISHHSMPMIRSASGVSWRICSEGRSDSTLPRPTTGRSLELCCCATSNRQRTTISPSAILCGGIITDIEMPNLDGLTLCRAISRKTIFSQGYPVAMFSSLISTSLAHKCKSVGADAQFAAKPDLRGISDKMYELIRAKPGPRYFSCP